jgi:hypothetical protein
LDVWSDWVNWLQCRLAWLLLARIGDHKPVRSAEVAKPRL